MKKVLIFRFKKLPKLQASLKEGCTEEKENNDTHRHILANEQEKVSYKFSEN